VTSPHFRLVASEPAERDLARLPEKAAAAVVETFGAICANPRRVGKPLSLEFAGSWAARRGPYRVIYTIDDSDQVVAIEAIGHREDVYRRR
jgi:mRNA interferase RelE/StbE